MAGRVKIEMLRSAAAVLLLLLPIIIGGRPWSKTDAPNRAFRQSFSAATEEKSCRSHPQLVGRCFSLRGRLSVYNGSPALRIWRVGTRRILGISEQRFSVAGYRNVPANIANQINQDVAIFGDFLVCPFTPSRPREMQLVCIDTAKNLVIKKQN
jgi:hypothetical protein